MNIALIPARGGSKRIPRKNIRHFIDRPIIAYSIQAALSSGLFEHVVVSTDDEEIAGEARRWGAETPFMRPIHLADDYTGTMDVIQHGLDECERLWGELNYVCCLYATAPFITDSVLCQAFQQLRQTQADYVFSVTTFPFPVQRALLINESQRVECLYPEHRFTRSQDLPPAYHDAGQFYFGKAEAFRQGTPLFSSVSSPLILPREQVQDIDTLEDWRRAELLFQLLHHNSGTEN